MSAFGGHNLLESSNPVHDPLTLGGTAAPGATEQAAHGARLLDRGATQRGAIAMISRASLPVAACFALIASVAQAQQEGLVNISIDGNTVQVPIGIAAQVCNVNVGVIQEATADGGTFECEQGDVNNPALENFRNSNAGGNAGGNGGGNAGGNSGGNSGGTQ